MRILRPLFHLVVIGLVVFLIYQFLIFPLFTVRAQVIHLIDADTLMVKQDNVVKKIQLIGVDAPDVAQGGNYKQCLSIEARKKVAELFRENREVILDKDGELGDTDVHGRLLRYVRLADGRLVNEVLLAEGLAHEFHPSDKSYGKQEQFESLQKTARAENLGLWQACGGEF